MGTRPFALAGLTILAALTCMAGADRIGLPVMHAGWLGANGLRGETQAALRDGRDARRLATSLIAAAPLRRGNLTLAVLAQPDAVRIEAASQLGWRDPYLQAWSLQLALAEGRGDDAAQRMEALLRAHPGSDLAVPMITALAADGIASQAFAERLAANPWWAEAVPMIVANADRASREAIFPVLSAAAGYGYAPDGIAAVERAAAYDLGDALAMQIALGGKGDLADKGLWNADPASAAGPRSATGPFAWRKAQGVAARLALGSNGELLIETLGASPAHVAGVFAPVEAGRYRLSWWARPQPSVTIDAQCVSGASWIESSPIGQAGENRWRDIEVPEKCSFLQFRMLAAGSGGRLQVFETSLRPLS